jgi:hypothetical protein
MFLDWVLCHRDGEEKGQLGERKEGANVRLEMNGPRTASVTVSSEEGFSKTIHPGRTRLKVRMHAKGTKRMLINGLIAQPKSGWLECEIPAVDTHFRLLNANAARIYEVDGDNSWEPNTDTELELSALMWKLIQSAGRRIRFLNDSEFDPLDPAPTLGIIEGDLVDTGITRTWNPYDLNTVWDALVAYTRKKGAPDFELQPLDREDGIHAQFNTFFPNDVRDEVVFELGYNLVDIGWEPSVVQPGLCNQYVLMGEASGARAPVFVAENQESMNRLGLYQRIEQASSELEMDQIEAKAREYVARHCWPVHFFDLTLPVEIGGTAQGWGRDALGVAQPLDGNDQYMVPPTYSVDYELGDIVTVRVDNRFKFGIENDTPSDSDDVFNDFPVRITAVEFEEVDQYGNVMVTLETHPVNDDAAVTGFEAYIAVDPD